MAITTPLHEIHYIYVRIIIPYTFPLASNVFVCFTYYTKYKLHEDGVNQ